MELAALYGTGTAPAEAAPATAAPGDAALQVQQPSADDTVVFTLETLGRRVEEAKVAVAAAEEALGTAREYAQELQRGSDRFLDEAASAPLLSDRLDAQRYAAQATADAGFADTEVEQRRDELAAAQARLAELEDQVRAASFNRAAAGMLAAPQPSPASDGGWVFPVGGGPAVVSVSHQHHDYPAADIAAPEGSPLYALADGTVLYSWPDDPRCGTGFTMRTFDGQTWTYCHLSSLEPSVVPGAVLRAGDAVGLVGQSGDATGPHLHLQLQPASRWPQDESWFESFGGVAFSWSDEPTAPAASPVASPPVFTIVEPS
jgi:murein DD-endopeptidase MepM/ murein hydrolase activator NlpD